MRHSPSKLAVLHGGLGPRRATATHALGDDEELPSEVLVHQTTKDKKLQLLQKRTFFRKERQGARPNMEKKHGPTLV